MSLEPVWVYIPKIGFGQIQKINNSALTDNSQDKEKEEKESEDSCVDVLNNSKEVIINNSDQLETQSSASSNSSNNNDNNNSNTDPSNLQTQNQTLPPASFQTPFKSLSPSIPSPSPSNLQTPHSIPSASTIPIAPALTLTPQTPLNKEKNSQVKSKIREPLPSILPIPKAAENKTSICVNLCGWSALAYVPPETCHSFIDIWIVSFLKGKKDSFFIPKVRLQQSFYQAIIQPIIYRYADKGIELNSEEIKLLLNGFQLPNQEYPNSHNNNNNNATNTNTNTNSNPAIANNNNPKSSPFGFSFGGSNNLSFSLSGLGGGLGGLGLNSPSDSAPSPSPLGMTLQSLPLASNSLAFSLSPSPSNSVSSPNPSLGSLSSTGQSLASFLSPAPAPAPVQAAAPAPSPAISSSSSGPSSAPAPSTTSAPSTSQTAPVASPTSAPLAPSASSGSGFGSFGAFGSAPSGFLSQPVQPSNQLLQLLSQSPKASPALSPKNGLSSFSISHPSGSGPFNLGSLVSHVVNPFPLLNSTKPSPYLSSSPSQTDKIKNETLNSNLSDYSNNLNVAQTLSLHSSHLFSVSANLNSNNNNKNNSDSMELDKIEDEAFWSESPSSPSIPCIRLLFLHDILSSFKINPKTCSPDLVLSNGGLCMSMSGTDGHWQSCRADKCFETGHGQISWTCKVIKTVSANMFIGVSIRPESDWKTAAYLGSDDGGYGFYGQGGIYHAGTSRSFNGGVGFKTGDVITCRLDCDKHTLSLSKNGEDLGVAVTGLPSKVWPAFSLYNKADELIIQQFGH